MLSTADLARKLPDLPRWVEGRSLLLQAPCEATGLQDEPDPAVVVRDPETESVFVIGRPPASAIHAAIQQNGQAGEVIAPLEYTPWLTEVLPLWAWTRIRVHTLPDLQRLPEPAGRVVGFLDPATLPQLDIDPELKQELESGAEQSPIAAAFVNQQPVAFCYAGAITESWWDVAIDTLPEHRRAGHAGQCAAHLIHHFQAQGKRPVWQALESNPASWRLAQKLGFVMVDELALWESPERAGSRHS